MAAFPAPSSKSLGKRPAKGPRRSTAGTPAAADALAGLSPAPASTPAKRVLPSRARRGGPGVGVCEVDMAILDALRRKGENEPLIPSTSSFLLTTDSSLVSCSAAASAGLELNAIANDRYFNRPEVIKASQEQQDIQTPEFTMLTDDARVAGRLRARGEEQSADTSDAAYERRHRKYETFERRQRLREKEKLSYEHYKLKERVEQLRGTDPAAFMALSASDFPPSPTDSAPALDAGADAGLHGAAPHEGERRRRIMLGMAQLLEQRYRVLLPDKKGAEKNLQTGRKSLSVSIEPDPHNGDVEDAEDEGEDEDEDGEQAEEEEEEKQEEEEEEEEEVVVVPQPVKTAISSRGRTIKLKISLPSRTPSAKIQSPSMSASARSERKRRRGSLPPLMTNTPLHQLHTTPVEPVAKTSIPEQYLATFPVGSPLPAYPTSIPTPPQVTFHNYSPALEFDAAESNGVDHVVDPSISERGKSPEPVNTPSPAPSPKKRLRIDSPNDPLYISVGELRAPPVRQHVTWPEPTPPPGTPATRAVSVPSGGSDISSRRALPAILVAAARNADGGAARKTSRHVLAFGVKVPRELEEQREFAIPAWLRESDDEGERKRDERNVHALMNLSEAPLQRGLQQEGAVQVQPMLSGLISGPALDTCPTRTFLFEPEPDTNAFQKLATGVP